MSIYFYETGSKDAPTIVFLHGGGISGWMWRKQVEYFKDYHCIVPDLPEHGKSIDEKPFSISDSANRIIELIQNKANGGKAHIVGHSLGGKIIVEILSIRPQVVDHAIVASALFNPMLLLRLTCNTFSYKLTVLLLKNSALLKMQAKAFKFPDEYYVENFVNESRMLTVENLDRIYSELYKHLQLPEGLSKVNVPTLVIAGEREPKAMRKSVIDLNNIIPNSKGIFIKGAIHNFPWVMSDTFNGIIRAWISDKTISNEDIINL